MNLVENKFLNECTQPEEKSDIIETNEDEIQAQYEESTLVIWDVLPGINLAN